MKKHGLSAVALAHVPFEDLGSLQPILRARGFRIETVDAPAAKFSLAQAASCDLLVVLGGPIGVYEREAYPFLDAEIECIRQRLDSGQPILGICLGAQLMAAAAGAGVYAGANGPEIGWKPIEPAGEGAHPEWFAPLLRDRLPVFHWHSDTFDLPPGAKSLARTDLYTNQAFTLGDAALALQFHPEVTLDGLERWYVGHAFELAKRGISVTELRDAGVRYAPTLVRVAASFWNGWFDNLGYIL